MNLIKIILFAQFLTLFTFSQEILSQVKKCNYCKKEVLTGQYLQVDGKFFHKDHFLCSHCGSKIKGEYYADEGKYFHERCYKNNILEKCSQCYKPIEGKYVNSNGKVYHQKCFDIHIALKCSHCGKTISGKYYQDYCETNIIGNILIGKISVSIAGE